MDSSKANDVVFEDSYLELRNSLWSALLLLGFDPEHFEKRYHSPINKNTFMLPNKKAFEVVMYFLFNKYDTDQATERFRSCWEVNDKKQEQEFRKVCSMWLGEIAKNCHQCVFPRIVPYLFLSPGGERFCEMLFAFATHILHHNLNTNIGGHILHRSPDENNTLVTYKKQSFQAGCIRHRKLFLKHVQDLNSIQTAWMEHSNDLVRSYRAVRRSVRELEQQVKTEQMSLCAHDSPRKSNIAADLQVESVKRQQNVNKVRGMWRQLDTAFSNTSDARKVTSSVLKDQGTSQKLEGTSVNVRVPNQLLQLPELRARAMEIGNTYREGRLDLLSVVRLNNLCLDVQLRMLRGFDARPVLCEKADHVVEQVAILQSRSTEAVKLREHLTWKLLPELKKCVGVLASKVDESLEHADVDPASTPQKQNSSELGLTGTTPPVSFEPASSPAVATLSKELHAPSHTTSKSYASRRLYDQLMNASTHKQASPRTLRRHIAGKRTDTPTSTPSTDPPSKSVILKEIVQKNSGILELSQNHQDGSSEADISGAALDQPSTPCITFNDHVRPSRNQFATGSPLNPDIFSSRNCHNGEQMDDIDKSSINLSNSRCDIDQSIKHLEDVVSAADAQLQFMVDSVATPRSTAVQSRIYSDQRNLSDSMEELSLSQARKIPTFTATPSTGVSVHQTVGDSLIDTLLNTPRTVNHRTPTMPHVETPKRENLLDELLSVSPKKSSVRSPFTKPSPPRHSVAGPNIFQPEFPSSGGGDTELPGFSLLEKGIDESDSPHQHKLLTLEHTPASIRAVIPGEPFTFNQVTESHTFSAGDPVGTSEAAVGKLISFTPSPDLVNNTSKDQTNFSEFRALNEITPRVGSTRNMLSELNEVTPMPSSNSVQPGMSKTPRVGVQFVLDEMTPRPGLTSGYSLANGRETIVSEAGSRPVFVPNAKTTELNQTVEAVDRSPDSVTSDSSIDELRRRLEEIRNRAGLNQSSASSTRSSVPLQPVSDEVIIDLLSGVGPDTLDLDMEEQLLSTDVDVVGRESLPPLDLENLDDSFGLL